jgi:hypothetical protein
MSFDPMGYPQFDEIADGQKDAIIGAEIERLRKCARFAEDGVTALTERLEEKDKLITELCDALELPFEEWTDQSDLIQRAREATK